MATASTPRRCGRCAEGGEKTTHVHVDVVEGEATVRLVEEAEDFKAESARELA